MKKPNFNLTCLVILALPTLAWGQSAFPKIDFHEYYEFYRQVLQLDSSNLGKMHKLQSRALPGNRMLWQELDKLEKDSSFTPNDLAFIKMQHRRAYGFKWSERFTTCMHVIPTFKINMLFALHKDGWDNFYRAYKGNGFCTWSVPLFSVDKTLCIVYTAIQCGGLCGGGATEVYHKINGKWILEKNYGSWIS